MLSLEEITKIEDEYHGMRGNPSLGRAYQALNERWINGARDRETALRLLFLTWYGTSEPQEFTGIGDVDIPRCRELLKSLGGEDTDDPEVLFAISIMATVSSFSLGDEQYWESIGSKFRARLIQIGNEALKISQFDKRGAYGDYFAHQWKSHIAPA
jgi:hypothetical protein